MENFRLHYAGIDLNGDIPCHEFKKYGQMIDFIDQKCIGRTGQVVWLVGKDHFMDVFVSESHLSIQDFLIKKYLWQTTGDYFLQEYPTYEDAFRVALDMVELSPLCYKNENTIKK
jgi:hypothetical protein